LCTIAPLPLIFTRHLGRHDRATPEVSQTLRSKWRDCVEGSVAIVLWEGCDCVAGSGHTCATGN